MDLDYQEDGEMEGVELTPDEVVAMLQDYEDVTLPSNSADRMDEKDASGILVSHIEEQADNKPATGTYQATSNTDSASQSTFSADLATTNPTSNTCNINSEPPRSAPQFHDGLPAAGFSSQQQYEDRPPRTLLTLPTIASLPTAPSDPSKAHLEAAYLAASRELVAQIQADKGTPMQGIPHNNSNGEGSSASALQQSNGFGMQDGQDGDLAWMEGEAEEDEREIQCHAIFAKLKVRKERIGQLSPEDDLEYYRAQQQLLMLNRLKNGRPGKPVAQDEIEEDSLFIADSNHERRDTVADRHRQAHSSQNHDIGQDDSNDDDSQFHGSQTPIIRPSVKEVENNPNLVYMLSQIVQNGEVDGVGQPSPDRGLKKNGEPRKRRAPVTKNAREVFAKNAAKKQEKEREKARKKHEREQVAAAKAKAKGKSKSKGKGKGKGSETGKGKNVKNGESLLRGSSGWGRSGDDELGQHILQSLLLNDDIDARLNNPIYDVEEEPQIEGRQVKDSQFAALFASIPQGSNKAGAREDKVQLKQAAKAFGHGQVKAESGKWKLNGMTSLLYHHQLIGARWMVERELSPQAPYGGILADSMGLGKTIQTLATMIGNRPMEADIRRKVKATLIVCPATLVQQWIEEIRKHTDKKYFPKVIHYKASSNLPREVLQDLDVAVTSYHEIMKTFPFPSTADREEIAAVGYNKWWNRVKETIGTVHQVNWYRVVLDEAHTIKNNTARTSLACQNLHSVYRWCLTGTPVMNRFEELFPYLRFLKADYTMDWKTFQKYFCDPHHKESLLRVNTLLSCCMFRRTMSSTILGRPIITLPKPHPTIEYVDFSPAEKIIYRITENRFRANLNKYFERGDANRNYGVFIVQLLRLRQITSHPWMLEQTMRDCWTLEDVRELRSRLSELERQRRGPFYEQTQIWIRETEADRAGEKGERDVFEALPFGQGKFGHAFHMSDALNTLNEQEMIERMTCGICVDYPAPPVETDCHHIFCKGCLDADMHTQAVDPEHKFWVCPTCQKMFNKYDPIIARQGNLANPIDEEIDGSDDGRRKKRRVDPDSKGIDLMDFEPPSDSTWISRSDKDAKFSFTPSVKTGKLKAILLKVHHEAPLDKVVVYVQFRTLARIVGRICKSEKWGFLYLTGDTSQDHRHKAIAKFKNDPDVKVLIAGLKCGGVGLNFPWANRVVSLDLWWNHAVEQQAFGRIFRIGQTKETYMTRIVVKQSIDMRLLTMQGHKLKAISKAIRDDDSANDKPNLSIKELANLFGFLRTDEDDNIISIEPDYDDMEEWAQGAAGREDGPVEWENVAAST